MAIGDLKIEITLGERIVSSILGVFFALISFFILVSLLISIFNDSDALNISIKAFLLLLFVGVFYSCIKYTYRALSGYEVVNAFKEDGLDESVIQKSHLSEVDASDLRAQYYDWRKKRNERSDKKYELKRKVYNYLAKVVGSALIVVFILVIGGQLVLYLKNGEWLSLPLDIVVPYLSDDFVQWYFEPLNWVGLHSILAWFLSHVPLSLILLIGGLCFFSLKDD